LKEPPTHLFGQNEIKETAFNRYKKGGERERERDTRQSSWAA
jgi:hypothetical protein